jgi:EPS-associated MarR family transcriptional regulator
MAPPSPTPQAPALSPRHDETLFKAMRVLDAEPQTTQRQLAQRLGLSLGKANYCLQALAAKGWVKMESFRNSRNKLAYSYMLTPRGMTEKASLTAHFLQRKMREYERLQAEIEQLRREAGPQTPPSPGSADRND